MRRWRRGEGGAGFSDTVGWKQCAPSTGGQFQTHTYIFVAQRVRQKAARYNRLDRKIFEKDRTKIQTLPHPHQVHGSLGSVYQAERREPSSRAGVKASAGAVTVWIASRTVSILFPFPAPHPVGGTRFLETVARKTFHPLLLLFCQSRVYTACLWTAGCGCYRASKKNNPVSTPSYLRANK